MGKCVMRSVVVFNIGFASFAMYRCQKKSGDGNVHPLLQYFLFFVCFCEVKIT